MVWFETLEKYVRALNINSKDPIFAFVADKTILWRNLLKRQIFSNGFYSHLNDVYPNTLVFYYSIEAEDRSDIFLRFGIEIP